MGILMSPPSPLIHREVRCGATTALYVRGPGEGAPLGLWLIPTALRARIAPRREFLSGVEIDGIGGAAMRTWAVEPLLQAKASDDDPPAAFSQGRTLRGSVTVDELRLSGQQVLRERGGLRVRTSFTHARRGWKAHHDLCWRRGAPWFSSTVTVENTTAEPLTLEMLASFSIGGVSPFAPDDAAGRLRLHRFRGVWSMEGRLETRLLEDLQLERSWSGYGARCERFGCVGSLPVNGFFPFAALEDTGAGVAWGARIAHPGSWQMEVHRRDDCVSLSGGLADWEFGRWRKTIPAGESFRSPGATLACVAGDLDDLCAALTAAQQPAPSSVPAPERSLPVIFNEWATSWGDPSEERVLPLARALRGSGVRYLVMDAGWYKPASGTWDCYQGEWTPNPAMYPRGIRATADAIRSCGLIPGLWFEMEVVGRASPLFDRTALLLHRDGRPVTCGTRRFLDLRKPEVVEHLAARVIGVLREGNFGYLKVDYNETIGPGVDGAESEGEGLRAHLEAVQAFFRRIRAEIPGIVIENCSSGGHRLEPSMLALTSMSSFSDAHECPEIPVIAANLHRLMLPRQSQVWAVLRAASDDRRTAYSLAAGFLGRLCLSGDFAQLRPSQRELVDRAIALYRRAAPVVRDGISRRHGPEVVSYRHARGWQAVVRVSRDGRRARIVAHAFAAPGVRTARLPLPPGRWRLDGELASGPSGLAADRGFVRWTLPGPWTGVAAFLTRA
jgi:alpha-galactosidase